MDDVFGVPILEQTTYRWPCEKYGLSKFYLATCNDCSWALLIVIAKARRTENCSHLNVRGKLVGIIGMRGIRTSCFVIAVFIVMICCFFRSILILKRSVSSRVFRSLGVAAAHEIALKKFQQPLKSFWFVQFRCFSSSTDW